MYELLLVGTYFCIFNYVVPRKIQVNFSEFISVHIAIVTPNTFM